MSVKFFKNLKEEFFYLVRDFSGIGILDIVRYDLSNNEVSSFKERSDVFNFMVKNTFRKCTDEEVAILHLGEIPERVNSNK